MSHNNYFHYSMANVTGNVSDDLQDYIPNVCTNSPATGSAFCTEHGKLVSALGYPTGLRDFLKSCANKGEIDPENYTRNMQAKVDIVLQQISKQAPKASNIMSCSDAQGLCFEGAFLFKTNKSFVGNYQRGVGRGGTE